jgi:hypothetical protein
MSWFSWHEPLITPAQGIYTFLGFLALYVLIRIGMWFFAEPSALPEMHEHVDGSGR